MSALTSRDDSPNDKECKDGHDDCCDPGDYIVRSPIDVTAHEAAIITKQYHQYKDQRQEHAAYHVGQVEHKDQAILWYEQGNAHAKQDLGNLSIAAHERRQGQRGILGLVDLDMVDKQGRSRAYYYKERHEVCKECADVGINLFVTQMGDLDVLVRDCGLLVELHPGRDGCADHGYQGEQVPLVELYWRHQRLMQDLSPVGMHEKATDDISKVNQAQHQQYALDVAVAATHHQHPNNYCRHRNGYVWADAEDIHRACDSREFGYRCGGVGDQQQEHAPEGDAHAEFFANQVGQPLAGDHAHTRRHFLHDGEADCDKHDGPQQAIAILRTRQGIACDTGGIIIDVGGDQPGADYGEQDQQLAHPDAAYFALPRQKDFVHRTPPCGGISP